MASPAQRLAWVTERTHKKAVREAEQSQRAARWNEPNTVALDDIEVPPSFAENEITKLWYMSHCGPDGQFEAPHLQFSGFSQQPPPPPLKRRLVLLGRLAPLVLPKYAAMLWQIAGWRIVLQVAADALIGLSECFVTSRFLRYLPFFEFLHGVPLPRASWLMQYNDHFTGEMSQHRRLYVWLCTASSALTRGP